jgi:hypothetical protein
VLLVLLSHGTDVDSAIRIRDHGLDAAEAAKLNATGEFWASADAATADWFAFSNPAGGPPVRLDFDVPEQVLTLLVNQIPPLALFHAPSDYEFSPASYDMLNQAMTCKQVVPVQ